jgi:hypothetical protein
VLLQIEYLKRMHGFPMCAICLEDPGSDVHERAKGLGKQDKDGAFVSDPEGAEGTSPAAPGRRGRGRRETGSSVIADEGPGVS